MHLFTARDVCAVELYYIFFNDGGATTFLTFLAGRNARARASTITREVAVKRTPLIMTESLPG